MKSRSKKIASTIVYDKDQLTDNHVMAPHETPVFHSEIPEEAQQYVSAAHLSPEIRTDLVEKLQNLISSGSYQVDSMALTQKMLGLPGDEQAEQKQEI